MTDPFLSLLAAVLKDDGAKVKELLDEDASLAGQCINEKSRYEPAVVHWFYSGDSVLHVAAAGYRTEIVRLLLAAGAEPDSAKNRRRSRPLHYASDGHADSPSWNPKRQVAMIRLLLKAGAKINAQDQNGATALHRAVRTRCAAAVKCLLDAGADPKVRNKPGSTAFHLAVQNTGRGGSGSEESRTAQREILQTFLAHGISPALKDSKGRSVLDWARSGWIRSLLSGRAHD